MSQQEQIKKLKESNERIKRIKKDLNRINENIFRMQKKMSKNGTLNFKNY